NRRDQGGPKHVSLHPEAFVSRQTAHFDTQLPPYRDWNTRAYLAKAERELKFIVRARQYPHAPDLRLLIAWWFNPGGVGAAPSSRFPFPLTSTAVTGSAILGELAMRCSTA